MATTKNLEIRNEIEPRTQSKETHKIVERVRWAIVVGCEIRMLDKHAIVDNKQQHALPKPALSPHRRNVCVSSRRHASKLISIQKPLANDMKTGK